MTVANGVACRLTVVSHETPDFGLAGGITWNEIGGDQACLTRGLRDQAFLIARLKLAGEMLLKPLYEVRRWWLRGVECAA